MITFYEKLKNARLAKGLKQADVAEILDCAPTSLTNWESGKVKPSLDVLSCICDVYDISPLELLDRKYSFNEILDITAKPVSERTYEEQIALNFSHSVLAMLSDKETIMREAMRIEEMAAFIQNTDMLNRFGGVLNRAEIEEIRTEYDSKGKVDSDILFAYHALTDEYKMVVLSLLSGLLGQNDNVQKFNDKMDVATTFTVARLQQGKQALKMN